MKSLGIALALVFSVAGAGWAQVRPPQPPTPRPGVTTRPLDSLRAGRDTTGSDTTAVREIVQWTEPDSIMRALMARAGYSVTRYQGKTVVFDAAGRALNLVGNRAAVAREQSILVGDTIRYNDSTRLVQVRGDTAILRDPSRNAADVYAVRGLDYDIETGRARVAEVQTALTSGETWYIKAWPAVLLNDTLLDRRTVYAGRTILTSCSLAGHGLLPHYHFESSEFKFITRGVLVARPAVLYISDIPVMWLPFIFQDLRSGRRSGITTPRFGIAELLRNSPTYRRTVDNLGYYFALNDYMDATVSLDWRSGARPREGDPGFMRYNGEWRYRWLDRFVSGSVGLSYLNQQDGATNTSVTILHSQDFSQTSHLTANINYVTSTQIQRRTEFVPYRALATIASRLNYQQKLGPFAMSLGGSRTQYPGRDQVDQTLPTLSLSSEPIDIAPWLNWSPSLSVNNNQTLNAPGSGPLSFRYVPRAGGAIDSVSTTQDSRRSTINFETPFRIGTFTWRNSITVSDIENNYPDTREIIDVRDTTIRSTRIFSRTFRTDIDWQTGISLPTIAQGTWNIAPSVSIVNIDPSGLWIRNERTGGEYVRQSKRLQYGVSASPTFFGLFPGLGPYSRFRHAVTTTMSYSYSPTARVSDEFLAALGRTRQGYLGSLAQNQVSLSLTTNLEAKLKNRGDSTQTAATAGTSTDVESGSGSKVNLLALTFQPLSWDFERARVTGRTGLTNERFGFTARSDLLPGLDFGATYSLFQGSILSDTSRFKPYREEVRASFSINRQRNPFAALYRVFGRAVPVTAPELEHAQEIEGDRHARQAAAQHVGGTSGRTASYDVSNAEEWSASFTFSSSRQRPPVGGGTVIEDNDALLCAQLGLDPISQDRCVLERQSGRTGNAFDTQTSTGGPFLRRSPTTTIQSNVVLPLTRNWGGSWQTTYDFEAGQFASHMVNLSRELHDWRATFSILQAPNGNFAFSFFIALKAQPDLKFDYQRQSYRRPGSAF